MISSTFRLVLLFLKALLMIQLLHERATSFQHTSIIMVRKGPLYHQDILRMDETAMHCRSTSSLLLYPTVLGGTSNNNLNDIDAEEARIRRRAQKVKEDAINYPPILLDPFPDAADPKYIIQGPIGEGEFIISREGEPTMEELSNENLYRILVRQSNVTDLEVNTLVWKCLGYRFDPKGGNWTATNVFPKWKERFPSPPDLIGMQRIYSKEIDGPSFKNNQHLVRSVPAEYKQSLKEQLKPLGFSGYKVSELTPNLTRRAQCCNWLLYYRQVLFGRTVEELQQQRRRQHQRESEEKARIEVGEEKKWNPPVQEVF
jgi:hypothetical protein